MPTVPPKPAPTAPAPEPVKTFSGRHTAFVASLEFFLAPLRAALADPEVTEIMVNGPENVYVEKNGLIHRIDARFDSEADLQAAANNIAQFVDQPLSDQRPLLDGRLPDGSRVCVVLGNIASAGTQINIRRFLRASAGPQFLLGRKAITEQALEFLLLAVSAHRNILVTGGSGSGKTTMLNVLTHGIGERERVLVIEDTRELQVQREHVVQLEARPADAYGRGQVTIRDLFVHSLRMRPDRIVVGEVRRGEALDMIQAMTSGHHGSLTTLHASTPLDALHRLETMALMADAGIPLFALRRQVASAIDLIVQTLRMPSGRRLVSQVAEVHFDESAQQYLLNDIFRLAGADGEPHLEWTGQRPALAADVELQSLRGRILLTKPLLGADNDDGRSSCIP